MTQIGEQIKKIEKEIRETPYHKGTEHYIGKLRARLSQLREKQLEPSKKGGGGGRYAVKKQGDATVVLVGPPSVGKSTLLNSLTNAQSKVAPYAFTTLTVIPGMMEYMDARIQILDVPGIIQGAEEGKGRGKEVLSVARGADLIILISDIEKTDIFAEIESSLEKKGIRLNQEPPQVIIEKKLAGGLIFHSNIKQEISKQTIKEVAQEMGIKNAEITIKEKLTLNRLIDAFSPNRVFVPGLKVINKSDQLKPGERKSLSNKIYISAEQKQGLEELKQAIWQKLNLIRVYLVRPEQDPSFDNPMVMKREQTLKDVLQKIGEEFAEDKTKAKIWNTGAKYPGQEVSLSTPIQEGMQIRFL